jgi:hypothetical protein
MSAFYVILLAGTTSRHPVKVVPPNVYMKIPKPENGRLCAEVDCSCKDIVVYSSVCGGRLPCTREALAHCKATTVANWSYFGIRYGCKTLFFVFFSSDTIRRLIITLCTGDIKTGNLIAKLEEILRHTDFLHTFHINPLQLHKLSSVKVLHL